MFGTSFVQLVEHEKPQYLLLIPTHCPPRTGPTFNYFASDQDLDSIINSLNESTLVALDFETKGGDYSDDILIVGLGLAWDTGSCYFDRDSLSESNARYLLDALGKHPGLIAHNVYFDGGVYKAAMGEHANWHMCTYSLYSYLANEGYAGRSWGLKTAQTELLLWEDSNEGELDEWLVINGYYKGNRRLDNTEEYLRNEYRTGNLSPEKGEMWRAPPDILGKYCILDAESTYLLYTQILRPALNKFPGLEAFIKDHWMGLIATLIDQKMAGIEMDREGLVSRKNEILAAVSKLEHDFLTHPETANHIRDIEMSIIQTQILDKEPPKLKKNGEVSKNWLKWEHRLDEAMEGRIPEYRFNMNSGPQLRELIYNRMGNQVKIFTEKGEPSVAYKALRSLGGIGSILTRRMELVKELSFIDKYLELTENRSTIHPSFRSPGTTTGRLSSKEPNLQQVPKTKSMMSLFKARPGTVWVDLDFSALEPCVATEYSNDPNMLQIYGDKASNPTVKVFTDKLDSLNIRWRIENNEVVIDE